MPIKILNCLHRSHIGGAQRRIIWVARELPADEFVTVVCFPQDTETEYEAMLRAAQMPFVRLPFRYLRGLSKIGNNLLFLLGLPLAIRAFQWVMKHEGIAVVHANGVTNL